mgnify:CR=1 FL=1
MKKGTFFMMLAAAASLASCTAQGPKANLKSDVDSLSYMMGVTNTQGLMEYVQGRLGVDSAYVADFIKGLEQGCKETDAKQKAYLAGMQIGQQVSGDMFDYNNRQIFGQDSTQALNKDNFLAGFIAAVKKQGIITAMLTGDAQESADAVAKETGIDALAISFGSSHGNYPEGYVPEFDFERLKEIKEKTKMPLVLHGGSGSGDENIKRCVEFGINKINVGCDFMNANVDSIKQHLKKDPDINYWVMMHQVEIDSQELVKKYIHLSGSEGKSL